MSVHFGPESESVRIETVNPRNSTYLIGEDESMSEGLAKATHASTVLILPDLPDFKVSPEEYFETVSSLWGIDRAFISTWSRKARSFITIPLILSDLTRQEFSLFDGKSLEPFVDGVLCWDSMHPLTSMEENETDITEFVEFIFHQLTRNIAPLWKLWISF
jgi:hypothetical protein